jgi:hypothetical protein
MRDDLTQFCADRFAEHVAVAVANAFERRPREDYNWLLKKSLLEFKRKVELEVDEVFEALHTFADETCEIPWIGGTYPPCTPQEQLVPLKQRVVRARCAQFWFEFEAPRWAQPLPLRLKDCQALYNQPNHRLRPVGEYGELLRALGWHLERAKPFEVFCEPPAPASNP